MKKKRAILIGIVFFLLLFLIPFIINEAYKLNRGYITLWGAAETLSFYAEFLGAIGTIGLGALSLWQNHVLKKENDKAQERLERINLRSNEINTINIIIEFEKNRFEKLKDSFDAFEKTFSPDTIMHSVVEHNDRNVSFVEIRFRSSRDAIRLVDEIKSNLSKQYNSEPLVKSLYNVFNAFLRLIDVYIKRTEPDYNPAFDELEATTKEFVKERDKYIEHLQSKLTLCLYGNLSFEEIKKLYEPIKEDVVNEQTENAKSE